MHNKTMKWFWISAFAVLGLAFAGQPDAHADVHSKVRVLRGKVHGAKIKVTIAKRKPIAGEEVAVTVHLDTIAKRHGHDKQKSAPISGATVEAFIGSAHAKPENAIAFAADESVAGNYTGSLTFKHASKEVVHLYITFPDKQKHKWSFFVRVKKPPHGAGHK